MVSRRLSLGAAGAGLTLLVIITLSFLPTLTPRPKFSPPIPAYLGFPAPNFTLPTDQGAAVNLSQHLGQVVVINFVILVCCSDSAVEMLYTLKPVWPTVQDRGVIFLSIALNSIYNIFTPADYRKIMNFTWTLALDQDRIVQDIYGARETSIFVIDRTGVIQYVAHEAVNATTLSAWLGALT